MKGIPGTRTGPAQNRATVMAFEKKINSRSDPALRGRRKQLHFSAELTKLFPYRLFPTFLQLNL